MVRNNKLPAFRLRRDSPGVLSLSYLRRLALTAPVETVLGSLKEMCYLSGFDRFRLCVDSLSGSRAPGFLGGPRPKKLITQSISDLKWVPIDQKCYSKVIGKRMISFDIAQVYYIVL